MHAQAAAAGSLPCRSRADDGRREMEVRVVHLLSQHTLMFNELRNSVPGVRQQVLSGLLREPANDGLVRRDTTERVGIKYALTAKGHELVALLTPLATWGLTQLANQGVASIPPAPKLSEKRAPETSSLL